MGNDQRLTDLNAELVQMVETSNAEIAELDRQIAALQKRRGELFMENFEKINIQRGRIAERENALAEPPQSHDKGARNDLADEARLALENAILNGA